MLLAYEGIIPVDKFPFSGEYFLPATVNDQGHRKEKEVPQVQDPSSSDDDMPLFRLICSNSEVGDEFPLRFLVSNFNRFKPSASTRFPHRSVTLQHSTSKLVCPSSPNAKFRAPRELSPYPEISEPRKRMRKGKKSTILSSTPSRVDLENEEVKKKKPKGKKMPKSLWTNTLREKNI
ncbi:hypothetical protein HHI36_013275 [Cryptolaemus montrouzieri]|uniref:Uncharacterized protein n=1 Tax=Cryptolaemus montrouzieri TaxID=559131 RepID=A0ABD2NHC8_9CUCU